MNSSKQRRYKVSATFSLIAAILFAFPGIFFLFDKKFVYIGILFLVACVFMIAGTISSFYLSSR